MATTFCTNHLRHRDRASVQRMLNHCRMLLAFVAGGTTAAVLCRYLLGKALLFTLLPLGYLFVDLLLEDIRSGKDRLTRKPAGH